MSATSLSPTLSDEGVDAPVPLTLPPLVRSLRDAWVVVLRNLTVLRRMPTLIVFVTIQPIMFVLLFRYVFGGAIQTGGNYVDFLMPGIFAQTVTFGAVQTGIGLAEDAGTGLVDRLRTLPMSRSALLTGRTVSDLLRNVGVLVLMVAVGIAVGFRPEATIGGALLATVVVLTWSFALSWVSAVIGLRTGDAETTQAVMFPLLFPITFASSAFVPTTSMPDWLRVFADNQPLTVVVDAVRGLVTPGAPPGEPLLALAWSIGIIALAVALAVRAYQRL
jgi:ABC-2 type transport system permease protein/oleandomycin transport system permease protein